MEENKIDYRVNDYVKAKGLIVTIIIRSSLEEKHIEMAKKWEKR